LIFSIQISTLITSQLEVRKNFWSHFAKQEKLVSLVLITKSSNKVRGICRRWEWNRKLFRLLVNSSQLLYRLCPMRVKILQQLPHEPFTLSFLSWAFLIIKVTSHILSDLENFPFLIYGLSDGIFLKPPKGLAGWNPFEILCMFVGQIFDIFNWKLMNFLAEIFWWRIFDRFFNFMSYWGGNNFLGLM
jgi:hypothetical protein